MEYNPLISIILPVYNGEKYLSQSIESVLDQTYRNIELIIVNDCSTDQTLSICNHYAKNDSRVKIINNNGNKKLPASLNIGHKESKGDYITWTSDDNFYEINALEVLLDKLLAEKADVVYSNFNLIDKNSDIIRIIDLPEIESIIFGNIISCCFLYRKEVFERNKGYNEDLFLVEDYDFWLRTIIHSRFVQIKKNLYNYRKHENSLTNQIYTNDEKHLIWKNNINKMYIGFWKNFSEENYFEMTNLSSNILMNQPISFQWLESSNVEIHNCIKKLKQNQNFVKDNLLERKFAQKSIEIMIKDKEKNNFLKSIFILKNYTIGLDKNAIKTLIKYSFFK